MKKKKIAVIMGGPSAEHEISLRTGFQVATNLDRNKYDVSVIAVNQENKFFLAKDPEKLSQEEIDNFERSPIFESGRSPCDSADLWKDTDLVFLALHGEFGEDGTVQGYLRTLGIKHTGCGITSSAIGMHKIFAKKIFEASAVLTPPYSVFRRGDGENKIREILAKHQFPLFVKAPQSGSSKLMYRVKNEEELRKATQDLIKGCKSVLVEAGVKGDEFSCPVLEKNGVAQALTPIYIKPKNDEGFFDYNAKYLGESHEICPPPHDKETVDLVKKTAVAVHTALECDGYSRTDIIVSEGRAFVLEVNTLPGMTSGSLFPLAFGVEGGIFSELLDKIIENALQD